MAPSDFSKIGELYTAEAPISEVVLSNI